MILLQGLAGLKRTPMPVRLSDDGSVVMRDLFAEAVMRGRVFASANQAGIVTQAGLSGTDAVLAIYNPPGSGVRGRLWYAGATFGVAFAAAAHVWLAAGTNGVAAAVTGTAATVRNLKLGGNVASQGHRLTAVTTATLPAAPVGISLLGVGLTGAITTVPQLPPMGRWYNGAILIEEGMNLSIQTSTASGAAAAFNEFIWEEEDL